MGREYRKHERKALGYPSTLLAAGGMFPCHILDVSAGGARLYVEDHTRIPDRFTVLLSTMGARREATAVWRRGGQIGVRFEMPGKQIPSAPVRDDADSTFLV